jgi:hypothetical protein
MVKNLGYIEFYIRIVIERPMSLLILANYDLAI